jgi:hypothetical protein
LTIVLTVGTLLGSIVYALLVIRLLRRFPEETGPRIFIWLVGITLVGLMLIVGIAMLSVSAE